jgi:hypothetical protein
MILPGFHSHAQSILCEAHYHFVRILPEIHYSSKRLSPPQHRRCCVPIIPAHQQLRHGHPQLSCLGPQLTPAL